MYVEVIFTAFYFLQGFWYFAQLRSREFQVNPRNPAKFTKTREIPWNSLEILPNTCQHNIFESSLGCWDCLLAVNLLIYLETSSPQRVNNIPKLPGVLRLMLRKTGKQRCKNPGVPRIDRGNWGWECDSSCSLWRMLRFMKDYALYVHLTYKDDNLFQNGSVHEWQCLKTCKMSRVHARSHEITNKPCTKHRDYRLEKQTIMLRSVPQMLKKWIIIINRISKVRQRRRYSMKQLE